MVSQFPAKAVHYVTLTGFFIILGGLQRRAAYQPTYETVPARAENSSSTYACKARERSPVAKQNLQRKAV